jgi:hypothetical protein
MDAFRLALISENSRLCYMAENAYGASEIVSTYKTYWGKWPQCLSNAIADIARANAIRGGETRLV